MSKQLAFYIDTSLCTACKACQVTCKDKNDLPIGVLWRRVYRYEGGDWMTNPSQPKVRFPVNVFAYSVSISCMHCQNPICLDVCPTGAIQKRDNGIVVIDQGRCIGCRYCEWACPYGSPQFNTELNVMTKCDFCEDLLEKGEPPACVAACPTHAIGFGELSELQEKFGNLDAIEPLPASNITQPSVVITPHKHAQMSGKGKGQIANLPEEI